MRTLRVALGLALLLGLSGCMGLENVFVPWLSDKADAAKAPPPQPAP